MAEVLTLAGEFYPLILDAVLATVRALTLTGVPSANVVRRALPDPLESIDPLPGVFVSASETGEILERLTFEPDAGHDVIYPVDVAVVGSQSPEGQPNEDAWLRPREQIRRALQTPPLAGVPKVWQVETRPFPPLPRAQQRAGIAVSGVRFLFHVVEVR